MKLLLSTLMDNIAAEKPVRTNELFFTAFCSPLVWRKANESMQQHIIRREQDFNRLTEASGKTHVSENLRCISGLDQREQLGVLSSVGNECDLKKASHALRIQYLSFGKARPEAGLRAQPERLEVVEDYGDLDDEAYFEDENFCDGDDPASDAFMGESM